jgi:hypothetical protein
MRQASRRSWRPGQTLPVRVPFLAYGGTMQADALALVAAKMRSALLVEGELPEDGLAALEGDDHDTFLALARRLVATDAETGKADGWDAQSLDALFAAARREEADADRYLVEGGWGAPAGGPVPPPRAVVHGPPADGAAATVWQAVFAVAAAGSEPGQDTPAGAPLLAPHGNAVVSFDELARLVVGRPRRRPRPIPAGQLTLLNA